MQSEQLVIYVNCLILQIEFQKFQEPRPRIEPHSSGLIALHFTTELSTDINDKVNDIINDTIKCLRLSYCGNLTLKLTIPRSR